MTAEESGAHPSPPFFLYNYHFLSVVLAALDAAKAAGAYKTILDCSESNVAFYEKAGLIKKEVQMVKYY